MHKKSAVLLYLVLLIFLLPFGYAETERLSPLKAVILNEFTPDIVPSSLDYYVGTFNVDNKNYIARTLLLFDINQINDIKNKHILNAYIELNVNLEQDFMTDSAYEISLHKVLERWQSATWNAQPEFDNNIIGKTTITGNGKYIINIKDIVKEWALNPVMNYGILIKGIDEDKTKRPNLKQIESINLVVEYEDTNECNRNGGICRSNCGSRESQVDYSCGFMGEEECCKPREIAVTTPTIATLPTSVAGREIIREAISETGEEQEARKTVCIKCPDINNDGTINIFDLVRLSLNLWNNDNLEIYDLNFDNRVGFSDLVCVGKSFRKTTEDEPLCESIQSGTITTTTLPRDIRKISEMISIYNELSLYKTENILELRGFNPNANDVSIILLEKSCNSRIMVGRSVVKDGSALFEEVDLKNDERYCMLIPGTDNQHLLRFEFYNVNNIDTERGKYTICDSSPLSNEKFVCALSQKDCKFFSAEYYGTLKQCEVFAKKISDRRFLCIANKYYDFKCYNQYNDCVGGVENLIEGTNSAQICGVEATKKNRNLWYLCYCVPVDLEWSGDAPEEINRQQITDKRVFILNNYENLEVKREYRCTQDQNKCLACPSAISIYQEIVNQLENRDLSYCDSPTFPRGVVSVHNSYESCLEESGFYECG